MFLNEIKINGRLIGLNHKPYIIAEAGSNFNQSLDIAKELIEVAVEAGADAVKFQLFKSEILYPDKGEMYDLFKSIELDSDWIPILNDYCIKRNITFLASPFDIQSVDILDRIDISAYKVASSETTNFKLFDYITKKNRPLIISTGMCDMVDVMEAINSCEANQNFKIALLQCGAIYPIPAKELNLNVIKTYKNFFKVPVGLSDHTLGNVAAITSIGLGACIFEKHFTLNKLSEGPDHSFALEPKELKKYISEIMEAYKSLGEYRKEMLQHEKENGRRLGIYASQTIEIDEEFTNKNIISKRPALGIPDRYKYKIIGTKSKIKISKNNPIQWENIN